LTSATRRRFAEVLRESPVDLGLACLLVGCEVEPDLDLAESVAVLDALAANARPLVPRGCSPAAAAEGLRVALGERAGFAGFEDDFADVRASLLHEVLRRGRGLPILLSVVWVEVARRLDVPAYCLGLPGQVVVGLGDPQGEHVVVDPFAGGRRSSVPPGFPPLPPGDLLLRLLTNIRVLTSRQERSLETARTRLWATELTLLLPRHPVSLLRERGELRVRLGEHLGGAQDLETYADVVEDADPDAATSARRAARLARARLN